MDNSMKPPNEGNIRRIRKRIIIPEDELLLAEEYARLDHRTFSELVCEALKQMRRRYPKTNEKRLMDKLSELEEKIDQLYKQVHYRPNFKVVSE
jgi:hypothetical protein